MRNQISQRYREPVHDSLEPLFGSSRAASSILATWIRRERTPRRRRLWPLRVLQGWLGPAEQKGHRRLSGTTRIVGIIDLLMVVINLGSPSFVSKECSRVPPALKYSGLFAIVSRENTAKAAAGEPSGTSHLPIARAAFIRPNAHGQFSAGSLWARFWRQYACFIASPAALGWLGFRRCAGRRQPPG